MREESSNGGVERWLASDEGMVGAHLSIGEKAPQRGKLRPPSAFIVRAEREEVIMVPHVGDKAPAACRSRVGFPYLGSLTGGPRSAFEPVA
jgi:hypothetical protein